MNKNYRKNQNLKNEKMSKPLRNKIINESF